MTRPTGWDVLGFDSDPVPGDPSAIRELGTGWKSAGTTITGAAAHTKTAASVADDAGSWQGDAGDAFRGDMAHLNTAMSTSGTWFVSAAAALETWATAVEDAQSIADRALAHATEAKKTHDDAKTAYDAAHSAWMAMMHEPPALTDEDQQSQQRSRNTASDHMSTAQRDLNDASQAIDKQTRVAQGAKTDYDTAAKSAAKALKAIADKIGKAPAIPGVGVISHSVSGSSDKGVWTVHTGGAANKWGSVGGQLSYGAGSNAHGDADFQLGPDGLSATAGGTLFVGGMFGASGAATFDRRGMKATAKGDVTAYAGGLATGRTSVKIGKDGMTADASGTVAAEAKVTANGSLEAGGAKLSGSGVAQAGAAATADGKLAVGPDGISAKAGISGYAGARAGVSGAFENHGVEAKAGVGVRAGVGFDLGAGGDFNANDVGVTLKVGGALGIGGDVSLDLHVHPKDMIEDAGKAVDDAEGVFHALTPW
jgi:uncharacterized protein YukE